MSIVGVLNSVECGQHLRVMVRSCYRAHCVRIVRVAGGEWRKVHLGTGSLHLKCRDLLLVGIFVGDRRLWTSVERQSALIGALTLVMGFSFKWWLSDQTVWVDSDSGVWDASLRL